jgi:hypothetical protein
VRRPWEPAASIPATSIPGASITAASITAGILTATLAILLLAGCSGSAGEDQAITSTPVGNGRHTTLARTVTGAVDLRRLVVSNAPIGYELLASPPFGAVDLSRLLETFSDAPAEDRTILERARFKSGYTRGWRREEPNSFLGIFVFEFAAEEGARAARDDFAAQNVEKKNASRFTVDSIPGAVGESYDRGVESEPLKRIHVVTFVRGPRLYQVTGQFADPHAPVDETVAFAMIEDQIAA